MTTEFRPPASTPSSQVSSDNHPNHQQNGAASLPDLASDTQPSGYRGPAYSSRFNHTIVVTRPARSGWLQRFNNLSVGKKQLTGVVTSEVISVLGLVGLGSLLIVSGGRSQLLNQARTELSVTDMGYNLKINQMSLVLEDESDNPLIVDVASADDAGKDISRADLEAVRQLLQNEVEAYNIEYATLVGRDTEIIASANADRRGQWFDPHGLVGTVLQNPRQIKTSAIVSGEELQNERAPLPSGFSEQDALVRYTITPVLARGSDEVVGALVAGDVVNGKAEIPQNTLETFENGYSAVYQIDTDGEFSLAASLDAQDNPDVTAAASDIPLASDLLLRQAVASPDKIVTRRGQVGTTTYALAAQAIKGFNGQPVAVLVRGTPEPAVNEFLSNGLQLLLLVILLVLIADVAVARLVRQSILRPLLNLQQVAWKFGMGDRHARADVFAADEIGRIAQVFNQLAESIAGSEDLLRRQSRQEHQKSTRTQKLTDLTTRIRQSLDEATILRTAVDGIRELLEVDRALIYQFHPDFTAGEIIAESVSRGWTRALGQTIEDPLSPESLERYQTGRVTYLEDRDRADLTHCHCKILERLDVKANMVAPLFVGDELIGLMCVHQCSGPRYWDAGEIELMQQLSEQLGYAVSQARLLQQQQQINARERQLNEIVAQMRESLEEERIYRTVVNATRQALEATRVAVYMFDEVWQGTFIAESVEQGWPAALGNDLYDPCFKDQYVEQYRQGRVQATANIYEAGLTECHLKQLEPYQVKANLVAPIVVEDKLLGLLIAHQCDHPRTWDSLDINLFKQVAQQLGFTLEQTRLFSQQKLSNQKEHQLNSIISSMRESLETERIYRAAVNRSRQALDCDRVAIYLFDATWKGTFAAESVGQGWPTALGDDLFDPCFADKYIEQYRQGRVQATSDIQNSGLTECHLKQLEAYAVKANLVAPIVVEERLLGLLIAHQCSGPRQWEQIEITFFTQVALQLGYALEQSQLLARATALSQENRQKQENLQQQLVALLSEVEGASRGDLTVRADVTAGEIGTVADFFNSIVESLRQIVTKVKQSAEQVNAALGNDEVAIQTLADEALRQADEVTQTLASIETMTASIQQVATSARQAAEVVNSASVTAETSGSAMDLTVQNILNLREIIGETSKKVKRLGESSQQISKAVSLINQIAMQTNLLAINAGIEAARAGEEGQGFAVVAEEVGELAARSADATKEIERIVETIQRETAEVVDAMDQSTTEVVAGTRLVEDAKQNLGQILEVSRQIDQLVQSISEATVSQVEISETVTQLMQAVAKESERTSKSSLQISESLRQTVNVARSLQDSVGTFKTDE